MYINFNGKSFFFLINSDSPCQLFLLSDTVIWEHIFREDNKKGKAFLWINTYSIMVYYQSSRRQYKRHKNKYHTVCVTDSCLGLHPNPPKTFWQFVHFTTINGNASNCYFRFAHFSWKLLYSLYSSSVLSSLVSNMSHKQLYGATELNKISVCFEPLRVIDIITSVHVTGGRSSC